LESVSLARASWVRLPLLPPNFKEINQLFVAHLIIDFLLALAQI